MVIEKIFFKGLNNCRKFIDVAFSRKYLFYTNVALSMSVSFTGDAIEQNYELQTGEIEKYDTHRTQEMVASGFTAGIICHHWYIFLDRIIVGKSFPMVLKKLLLDQCLFSPFIILTFFATVALFDEDPIKIFNEEVSEKFWVLYKAEWTVWPIAQVLNFYFIPTRFRVAYDNTISLGYDVYTSRIRHSKGKGVDEKGDKHSNNSDD